MIIEHPAPDEYAPFYQKYIELITEDDLLAVLRRQPEEMRRLLASLGEERADYRYAPGKWSVKEVVGHTIDSERIFAYRALRIGRGDETPLPGFDQDVFVANDPMTGWTLAGLADAFERARAANMDIFEHFDASALRRVGTANGFTVSVRALLYIAAGHARHHMRLLETRYA